MQRSFCHWHNSRRRHGRVCEDRCTGLKSSDTILSEEVATLAQDAVLAFGTLNDNLDRLIDMTKTVAATRDTWASMGAATFGRHE